MAESQRLRRQRLGPYELVSELGRGAMGVVYRARDLRDGSERAVKTLDAAVADAELLARFQREAEALAAVPAHPHLVQLREAGAEAGICWFAMDLFEGGSLRDRLRGGPIELRQAAAWTRDVARGLVALHAQGLVHRDVKPGNVLIDDGGAARLADLGLVRSLDDRERLTRTGTLLGTPVYMPPEALVAEPWGPAGDVYSLGQVLLQLVSGHTAVPGGSAVEVFAAISSGRLRPLRELCPEVPSELEALYERMRQRDPARRPGADEVAETLDAWLQSEARGGASRGLRLAGAAAFCSLLALGGLLVARSRHVEAPSPAPPPTVPPTAAVDPDEPLYARAQEALAAATAAIASDPRAAARECAEVPRALLPCAGLRADALREQSARTARWAMLRARGGRVLRLTVADERTKVQGLAFSHDGRTLFVASKKGLEARSIPAGVRLEHPVSSTTPAQGCLVDPGGSWMAVVEERRVLRWELGEAGAVRRPEQPLALELDSEVQGWAASYQGTLAAVDSFVAVLCDASGRQHRKRVGSPRLDKKWAAFHPDGGRLAVAGDGGAWILDAGARKGEQVVDGDDVNLVAFSPDGRMLLMESSLRTFRLDPTDDSWEEDDEVEWEVDVDAESCATRGDLLVTGLQEKGSRKPPGMFLLWDLPRDGPPRYRPPHAWHGPGAGLKDTVRACAIAPELPLLACGDDHGVVCLFWFGDAPPPDDSWLPELDDRTWRTDPLREVQRLLDEAPLPR